MQQADVGKPRLRDESLPLLDLHARKIDADKVAVRVARRQGNEIAALRAAQFQYPRLARSRRLVLGYAGKYFSRKGARPGDRIYVTGHIGDAACGLSLMKTVRKKVAIELGKKHKFPLPWEVASPLLERHLMPEARDPRRFKKKATSMIDISDGLMIDLSRLCKESRVGALVYTDKIPLSDELERAA